MTFEKGRHLFKLVLTLNNHKIDEIEELISFVPFASNVEYMHSFPDNISSYRQGTTVGHEGYTYRCITPNDLKGSNLCALWTPETRRFEPGVGWAWQDVWELVGTSKVEAPK